MWIDELLATNRYGVPAVGAAVRLLKGLADALNPALTEYHNNCRALGDPADQMEPKYPADK